MAEITSAGEDSSLEPPVTGAMKETMQSKTTSSSARHVTSFCERGHGHPLGVPTPMRRVTLNANKKTDGIIIKDKQLKPFSAVAAAGNAAAGAIPAAAAGAGSLPQGLQALILEQVMRNLESVKKRMNEQQEEALRKVEELHRQSLQLEGELERQRERRRSIRDGDSLNGSRENLRRSRRATIASTRDRTDAVGSRESSGSSTSSTAVKALRRFSTSSASTPKGNKAATAGRRSLGGAGDPELQVQRHWMMEQRAILLDDLFPES